MSGRSGFPTWARLITKACRLSHFAAFRSALTAALGDDAADILAAWDVFCPLFEAFLGEEEAPLEVDSVAPYGPEDLPLP